MMTMWQCSQGQQTDCIWIGLREGGINHIVFICVAGGNGDQRRGSIYQRSRCG